MSDIVERLRDVGTYVDNFPVQCTPRIACEAAAEIESLRSRLARLEEVYATTVDCWKADGERLAEAEALLRQARDGYMDPDQRAAIDAYLSLEQPRCPATLGNAGQCYKPEGHDGQHSLLDASIPPWEQP